MKEKIDHALKTSGFLISVMKADQTILQRLDAPHWPVGVDGNCCWSCPDCYCKVEPSTRRSLVPHLQQGEAGVRSWNGH